MKRFLVGLAACLVLIPPTRAADETDAAKVKAARISVANLTRAAQAYRVKTGDYPKRLEDLEKPPDGGSAYIDPKAKALIDPWGHPYKYDPAGPRNKGKQPDVWSQGPDPNDKKGVIGNWQELPKGKK